MQSYTEKFEKFASLIINKPLDDNPMVQNKNSSLGFKNYFRSQIEIYKRGNISYNFFRCGKFNTAVPHTHTIFYSVVLYNCVGPVYHVHGVISVVGTARGCAVPTYWEQTRDTGLFGNGRMSCVACDKTYDLGLCIGNCTIYMMI